MLGAEEGRQSITRKRRRTAERKGDEERKEEEETERKEGGGSQEGWVTEAQGWCQPIKLISQVPLTKPLAC